MAEQSSRIKLLSSRYLDRRSRVWFGYHANSSPCCRYNCQDLGWASILEIHGCASPTRDCPHPQSASVAPIRFLNSIYISRRKGRGTLAYTYRKLWGQLWRRTCGWLGTSVSWMDERETLAGNKTFFLNRAKTVGMRRRMMLSNNGHLIMGPDTARLGDICASFLDVICLSSSVAKVPTWNWWEYAMFMGSWTERWWKEWIQGIWNWGISRHDNDGNNGSHYIWFGLELLPCIHMIH